MYIVRINVVRALHSDLWSQLYTGVVNWRGGVIVKLDCTGKAQGLIIDIDFVEIAGFD